MICALYNKYKCNSCYKEVGGVENKSKMVRVSLRAYDFINERAHWGSWSKSSAQVVDELIEIVGYHETVCEAQELQTGNRKRSRKSADNSLLEATLVR